MTPATGLTPSNAISDQWYYENKINFWGNVYGFNMTPMRKEVLEEPLVDELDSNSIITNDALILVCFFFEHIFFVFLQYFFSLSHNRLHGQFSLVFSV